MVNKYCICEREHETDKNTMKAEIDYFISASGVINVTKARCMICNQEHNTGYEGISIHGRVVNFDYFRYREDK